MWHRGQEHGPQPSLHPLRVWVQMSSLTRGWVKGQHFQQLLTITTATSHFRGSNAPNSPQGSRQNVSPTLTRQKSHPPAKHRHGTDHGRQSWAWGKVGMTTGSNWRVLSRRRAQAKPEAHELTWVVCEHFAFMEEAGRPLIHHKQANRICRVMSPAVYRKCPRSTQPALLLESHLVATRSKNLSSKIWPQIRQPPSCPGFKISCKSRTSLRSHEQGWPQLSYRCHQPLDSSGSQHPICICWVNELDLKKHIQV